MKTELGSSATEQTNVGRYSVYMYCQFDEPTNLHQRAKYFSVYRLENLKSRYQQKFVISMH
jgi:hypothetical protein